MSGVDDASEQEDLAGYWQFDEGEGNIDTYPVFADSANDDYSLSDLSPAISAAADSGEIESMWYYAPPTDIEGNPRPNPEDTNPDMGAYENSNGTLGSYEPHDIAIDVYSPTGLTWDGENFWVPGGWATDDPSLTRIFKIDPETGAKVDSIPTPSNWPGGITWDGVSLWVTDFSGGPQLFALSPEDGSINSSFTIRYSSQSSGVATDGYYLYYGISGDYNRIYQVDPTNGAHVDSLELSNYYVSGLTWDGSALWFSDSQLDSLYRVTMDGTILSSIPSPGSEPAGLTMVDNTLMNVDMTDNMIYAIEPPAAEADISVSPEELNEELLMMGPTLLCR